LKFLGFLLRGHDKRKGPAGAGPFLFGKAGENKARGYVRAGGTALTLRRWVVNDYYTCCSIKCKGFKFN